MMKPTTSNCVSIQLPLGGHSFSSARLGDIVVDNGQEVRIIVDTAKCALIPQQHFSVADVVEIARASGITVSSDEIVVCSPDAPIIAVMAINASCHATLIERYGNRISFTTPLLNSPMPDHGSVIHLSASTLYVRVANEGLKFAEAIGVDGDADILYMLENINKVYNIYNMYARAEGDTKRLLALCKRSFSNLVCE